MALVGFQMLHGLEDLMLNVIPRVKILAVPYLDNVAIQMNIANVTVALIIALQILVNS